MSASRKGLMFYNLVMLVGIIHYSRSSTSPIAFIYYLGDAFLDSYSAGRSSVQQWIRRFYTAPFSEKQIIDRSVSIETNSTFGGQGPLSVLSATGVLKQLVFRKYGSYNRCLSLVRRRRRISTRGQFGDGKEYKQSWYRIDPISPLHSFCTHG